MPQSSSNRRADTRNRALGFLTGYLWSKHGVSADTLRAGLLAAGRPFSPHRLKNFREGAVNLSPEEYAIMSNHITALLVDPNRYQSVLADYAWIRPVLLETDIDHSINPHGRNQIPLDRSFLRALNVDPRDQRRHRVYERIGGLWHIIRLSAAPHRLPEDGYHFNVALLNIKPTSYISSLGSSLGNATNENIRTLISHFSLRSRLGTNVTRPFDIFRGRMFESDNVTYFVGDRRQYPVPKLFFMAWSTPLIPEGETHAHRATGIMMTMTADNATMSGPIIARYIDDSIEAEVPLGLNMGSQEWQHYMQMAKVYDDRITSQFGNLKTFEEGRLFEAFEQYNEKESIIESIRILKETLGHPTHRLHHRL